MLFAVLAFGFVALGSKVILGFWAVWILLPAERECARCDGFTTQVEPRRGLRTVYRWCRIQDRWCPGCGEHYLARGRRPPEIFVGEPRPEPRRRGVPTA